MRLPPNFARERLMGSGTRGPAVRGCLVRVGDKGCFIPDSCRNRPNGVRKRLEAVLGIKHRVVRSEEERLTSKARNVAQQRRTFRNRLAAGETIQMPWVGGRTLATIKEEEKRLDIAQKWQRMGEYRR